MKGNVKIDKENITAVKLAVIGTSYNIASFYAEAATEKIERDNLRKWIETPAQVQATNDHIDKHGGPY